MRPRRLWLRRLSGFGQEDVSRLPFSEETRHGQSSEEERPPPVEWRTEALPRRGSQNAVFAVVRYLVDLVSSTSQSERSRLAVVPEVTMAKG